MPKRDDVEGLILSACGWPPRAEEAGYKMTPLQSLILQLRAAATLGIRSVEIRDVNCTGCHGIPTTVVRVHFNGVDESLMTALCRNCADTIGAVVKTLAAPREDLQ